MRRRGASAALALAAALAAVPGQAEDLRVVYEVRGLVGKKTVTESISGTRVAIEDGAYKTLLDTATGRATVIDQERKRFWETSLEELTARASSAPAPPPAPSPAAPAPQPMLQKEAGSRVVAGFECDLYTLTAGAHRLEVCAARELQAPAHAAAQRLEAARMGPSALPVQALYTALGAQVPGLPLAEKRTSASGRTESRQYRQALEVKREALPAATFQVPDGYARVDPPRRGAPSPPPAASPRPQPGPQTP